jgi:hypothetical protein
VLCEIYAVLFALAGMLLTGCGVPVIVVPGG